MPPKNANWEDFDRLLVGEFLRRHHPRLAHEIALYGMPGKDGSAIKVCLSESQDQIFLADMSGLVARSHGMDLRSCVSYIERRYKNRVNPRRVHAVFLMVLLRLADYFQIQSSRAPTERTDVETFHSGLSVGEWKVHQCITDIHNTSGDPEAIIVDAVPQDVSTFLRLKGWLSGLQHELDTSWAVLGEVFGLQTHNNLQKLSVKVRRVKSNLDDYSEFSKTVAYVPAKITFDTASSDLLKLLVGPLYNNDVSIGIRELIQNAVDAVREFDDLLSRQPSLINVERRNQDADVVIHFECDNDGIPLEIIITDRGVGMTTEIIKDFFLKAGASFRRSDAWRRNHENNVGKSRILRTGRFGVGALAAFLLGDEITVTTRHVSLRRDEGVTFTARIDSEAIELLRTECSVGTEIRIPVPEHMRNNVKRLVPNRNSDKIGIFQGFAQYFLKFPSVRYEFSHIKKDLSLEWFLPQPDDSASVTWRLFKEERFDNVFWTYEHLYPLISCNGIPIVRERQHRTSPTLVRYIRKPNVSIFDKNGYLPVNLQRTEVEKNDILINEELLSSITDDLIAHAIVSSPNNCQGVCLHGIHKAFERDRYYSGNERDWAAWIVCQDGFILNDPHLLVAYKPRTLLVAVGGAKGYDGWGDRLRSVLPEAGVITSYLPGIVNKNFKSAFRQTMDLDFEFEYRYLSFSGARTYVSRSVIDKINSLKPGAGLRRKLSLLSPELGHEDWLTYTQGVKPPLRSRLFDEIISLQVDTSDPVIFCELAINEFSEVKTSDVVAKRWTEVVGTPVIPFNLKRRRELEAKVSRYPDNFLQVNHDDFAQNNKKTKDESSSVGLDDV